MECKICGSESRKIFVARVLREIDVEYYQCNSCFFAFTEKPYWLSRAYEESLNLGDTGQVQRLFDYSLKIKYIIRFLLDSKGVYLDFAGGYGLFTRRMRDLGFKFFWQDLYTKNLFARGFEENKLATQNFEAITVIECFEHWEDPMFEIASLFLKTDVIIFSTNLITSPAPKQWWYYGFDHGQHISFFSKESFSVVEKKFSCYYYSKNGIHILSKRKISKAIFYLSLYFSKLVSAFNSYGNKKSLTSSDHKQLIAAV